jgi:hypothetical protein
MGHDGAWTPMDGGLRMSKWIKRIIALFVVAFVLFFVFTRPEQSALAVRTFFGAFESIYRFFESLVTQGK